MATFRTTGEVKTLPTRNTWGQKQYRVAVDAIFAASINAEWKAAHEATPKACLNTTAPAWYNEELKIWTVTASTGQAGMYPAGVTYGKLCNVSFRIGKDKYFQIIASAVAEIAEENAIIAVERMESIREAVQEREFDEQITGINSKLSEMAKLAAKLGIPLGDLMSADKAIEDEKARAAAAKKALTQKGSSLRSSSGASRKADNTKAAPETDLPVVTLSAKTITKWESLGEDELQSAMETYAETVDVDLADVQAAWELATADAGN